MHRAASFADFGQQMSYGMGHASQRPSIGSEGQDFGHGHGVPSQHSMHMLQRTASMPQHYYVIEQSNPGIATMNTTGVQQAYHVPRQHVERTTVEIPYSAGSMTSMSSSPGSFSPASGQSPTMADGMYTHQAQPATAYTMQEASMDQRHQHQHQHPMVQYPQQVPSNMPAQPQQQPSQSAPEHFQQASQSEAWCQYQPPVEVATIGQLPPYGSGLYGLYGGTKMEFEDPAMQLPSTRIETM